MSRAISLTRVARLEAQRQRTLDAQVNALERNPRVMRYMDALPLDALRLLAHGDPGALEHFGLALDIEVT